MFKTLLWIESSLILPLVLTAPVLAQSITPAPDGTGTVVHYNGNTYHIQGGTQAGANLFHSFQTLGLSHGEIANFLSNPSISNIFGRVTGGDPSIIEGLLQVTGANSNLYLMNPAGIVFGSGASLNVGGDFFATTADRIGFGQGWFNASGANDYAMLVGAPNQFAFLSGQPGAILNGGELNSAQGIALIGGTVANTGTITAGNVTLAAVPGTRLVNLAQAGMLLSLDLPQDVVAAGITPLDLPSLLTAAGVETTESLVMGNVQLEGTVSGAQVDLLAANRVTVTAPGVVAGDARVVRFSADGDDPEQAVFIGGRADHPEDLLYGAEAGTVSQIIERDENGIEVISEQLAVISESVGELESVVIAAEGNEGNFWLGSEWIRSENIADYAAQLQSWGTALTESADLLLYSCFTALGASGEALMNSIANLTGVDVAASVNATGSSNYGGDWLLEASTGSIEARNPFTLETLAGWDGKLNTLTVDDFTDTGSGDTLRNQIAAANAGDTVIFTSAGTINLNSTIQWTTDNVTLDGNGGTVEGNGVSRVFEIYADNPTIQNLTIQKGRISGGYADGGGIFHIGYTAGNTLTLNNTTVSNNIADRHGGGILSNSDVILNNSTISNNSASNNFVHGSGGGLMAYNVTLNSGSSISNNSAERAGGIVGWRGVTLNGNSTVSGNTARNGGGGGISGGNVTLNDNSTVSGNTASDNGGGIIHDKVTLNDNASVSNNVAGLSGGGISGGNVTLNDDSTVSGNSAGGNGGGIARGKVTLNDDSTVSGNTASGNGGGIFSSSGISDSFVTLNDDSTVANNSAGLSGGGIASERRAVLNDDSTVSGNSASSYGGGIFSERNVILTNATVSGNFANLNGGGISTLGDVTLDNAIVSGNTARNAGGGGIASRGDVALTNNANVFGNSAALDGGGIASLKTVELTNGSTVTDNLSSGSSGGGIASVGDVTLDNAIVSRNSTSGNGGGIASSNIVTLTNNSTVANNSANTSGGGIFSDSTVINGSTVSGNSSGSNGGGVFSADAVTLTNGATVSGNSTTIFGGGIYSGGDVNLTAGATVSGNIANISGGGIRTGAGNINGTNSTFLGNAAPTGGGIYSQSGIISLTDHQGDLDLDLFARNAVALSGSGAITLTGDVQTGGQVFGVAATGNLTATGLGTLSTAGGALTLISTGGAISAGALNTAGGALTLTSMGGEIHAGALDTRTNTGDGGAIAVTAAEDIAVATLTTQATHGTGGAVTLTSNRHIRVSSSLGGFSINTAGTTGGGDITLTHGGNGRTLFSIGNASINGTAGAITTGSQTLAPTDPTHEFLGNYTKPPGIQILTNAPIAAIDTAIATVLNPPQPVTALDMALLNTANENVLTPSAGSGWGLNDVNIQAGSLDDPAILAAAVKLDSLLGGDFAAAGIDLPDSNSLAESWIGSNPGSAAISALINALGLGQNNSLDEGAEDVAEEDSEDDDDDSEDDAQSIANIRETFKRITEQTGTIPTFIYAIAQPEALELIVVTPDNQLLHTVVAEADRHTLQSTIRAFRRRITSLSPSYITPAQQLYDWLIRPVENTLEDLNIDTLVFAMGDGLRTIPLAALHDGEQFLIEKYSLGQIPSLSLTDSSYVPLQEANVLAMGASQFSSLNPLPAVPSELALITSLKPGEQYLNQNFTWDNLATQSRDRNFEIVHLATHAAFKPGSASNSYIQLWGDDTIGIDELRELRWFEDPQVELLVLSACETAFGDPHAELGFAGLAVQAGVKSTLASLWQISDLGTMRLMREFYEQLGNPEVTIKAEALRQAQLALLRGEATAQNALLEGMMLPPELVRYQDTDLTHPFYWSAFTLVGSPW
ncbi:MAG: CHAT domain-containing protein [Cyanobacteria bacterium P01_G01_bin.54]